MYTEILEMNKYCVGCGEQIHPKRVEILPTTKTCVGCSTTGVKRGVTVLNGDVNKDDTWVDIVFLEQEEFDQYERLQGRMKKIIKKSQKSEFQDYDDSNTTMPGNVIDENIID
tara:strand:- start:1227 stop:1565 length:339 start_codon:yes stop_codon:yes gene_type:complete